ncbi:MAG TPA: N-acetylmuramoyl-L-alanine amidase [Solirubrobacteraceae bacterium]|jgi:N-acetylmuramoyl-L-alanine amidase|nr:N-acetylmuramoyl-L-alanine amidase [Solirubrobacteraceae bacterium]
MPRNARRHPRRISPRAGILVAVVIGVTAGVISGGGGRTSPSGDLGPAVTAVDSARFARGSCMAYAPTHGNRHLTVFLDAGHGGLDPGGIGRTASGKTISDAGEALPVELDALALLRAQGFRVVVSRTTDNTVARLDAADVDGRLLTARGVHDDVAARAQCANEAHAKALVGIYFDTGGASNAGAVTGYDTARRFAAANLRLATLVQDEVLASMNSHGWQIPSGGVQQDDQLGSTVNTSTGDSYGHLLLLGPAKRGWFSTPSLMPGALIEPLFITDPFEGSIADSSAGRRAIAGGIAEAVEQFLKPPAKHAQGRSRPSRGHARQ